ncbi:MAG: hypothetical protein ACYCS2_10230 [Acidimicrobiales bacterium]
MTVKDRLAALVVGTDDWAVTQAAETLRAAGITALTCHEPGQPVFPCNAFRAGHLCPLDAGADVVLVVRARPVAEPTPGEMGAICGMRAHLRLVASGMAANSPFGAFAAADLHGDGDVAEACRRAATVLDDTTAVREVTG